MEEQIVEGEEVFLSTFTAVPRSPVTSAFTVTAERRRVFK